MGKRFGVVPVVVIGAVLGFSACGSEEPSKTTKTTATTATAPTVQLKESPAQAADRIKAALKSGDCKQINALLSPVYAQQGGLGAASCKYVQALAPLKIDTSKAYGNAAVVDYYDKGPGYYGDVVLTADPADGLFKIVYINPAGGVVQSTKTLPEEDLWAAAATTATRALRTADCATLLSVAYYRFGVGSGKDACKRLPSYPAAVALKAAPDAAPKFIGGNSSQAFYSLETPQGNFTMVFQQQPPSTKLPADAARYAFVGAYPAP